MHGTLMTDFSLPTRSLKIGQETNDFGSVSIVGFCHFRLMIGGHFVDRFLEISIISMRSLELLILGLDLSVVGLLHGSDTGITLSFHITQLCVAFSGDLFQLSFMLLSSRLLPLLGLVLLALSIQDFLFCFFHLL